MRSPFASFGAAPAGARLERMLRSPHFNGTTFQNPVPTQLLTPGAAPRILRARFAGGAARQPTGPVPLHGNPAAGLRQPPRSGLRVTWLGHASALLEFGAQRFLLDPVWSERVSPFSRVGPRRFHAPPLALAELPPLDAIVLSHDHYDHLDAPTIAALLADSRQAAAVFVAPLGVGAHLERFGVPIGRILELDLQEAAQIGAVRLTATPARHFSRRALRGNGTLWCSYVFASPEHRVFFSGDSGFFPGYSDIGATYGPFDLSLIAIGAYSDDWPDVHLTPEEALQAHALVKGGVLLPVHWATFDLAPHPWAEPPERLLAARPASVPLALPRPGEPLELSQAPSMQPWWRNGA